MSLSEAAILPARGSERTELSVLVYGFGKPIDPRVAAYSLVLRIDHDDFEVLVHRILPDPVGIQNTQCTAITASTFL